jgi:hypothetical protein
MRGSAFTKTLSKRSTLLSADALRVGRSIGTDVLIALLSAG